MKKLIILISIFLSVFAFVFANNEITTTDKTTTRENSSIIKVIELDANTISVPFVMTAPAPQETIKSISGPCNANMENWKVENGTLYITYSTERDIMCLQDPDEYHIEIATYSNTYYNIIIITK